MGRQPSMDCESSLKPVLLYEFPFPMFCHNRMEADALCIRFYPAVLATFAVLG